MNHAATLRAGACFALLVAAVWAPFTLGSGMPHETGLPYSSETRSALKGFLYPHDRMRVLMTFFFHVAYLAGELGGVGGSFVPYQLVYALLWWARGLLGFLILRRVAPEQPVFHLAAGGLVILHGADTTLNWVGATNQQGMLFWTLAAVYALVRALQASTQRGRLLASGVAAGLLLLSLWSYESQIAIVCLLPVLLARAIPARAGRFASMAPWYAVVALYLLTSAVHYLWLRPPSYQASLLRADVSLPTTLSDLVFLLRACFEFWRWGDALPLHAGVGTLAGLAGLAALALALALALEVWLRRDAPIALPAAGTALRWLAVGGALALLAFPAFLLLRDAATPWRTQILASVGAGLTLTAASAALAALPRRRRFRELVFVLLVSGLAWFGARAALTAGAWERELWERHRVVMAGLLHLAPDLTSPTLVVLTGVPAAADPFLGDNQWFVTALRLAYPGRTVYGYYQMDDGAPAAGAPSLDRVDARTVVAFELRPEGVRLLAPTPGEIVPRWQGYAPQAHILPGPPAPRALRRYGPSP